ncbi:50S ribosomal protein L24 [Phormidium willei BDU 130791]|nr:50S ribosomal protein L24 [Phormidium willei BDU 130791]
MKKFKIKKGDRVIVTAGRSKGVVGEILRVDRADERVVVQGANLVKRHQRPSAQNPEGGIVEMEAPVHISNVAHVDPEAGDQPTRVGYRFVEGRKVRYAKRSGAPIDS